jgi:hypothetical protein
MNLAINAPEALSYKIIEPWMIIYGGFEFVIKKFGLNKPP